MARVKKPAAKTEPGVLKGWPAIAAFLGHPISVVQRWAKSGMPVAHEGRRVVAKPQELNFGWDPNPPENRYRSPTNRRTSALNSNAGSRMCENTRASNPRRRGICSQNLFAL